MLVFLCIFQEMLGLSKPTASGQPGRPPAPQDATASCRYANTSHTLSSVNGSTFKIVKL